MFLENFKNNYDKLSVSEQEVIDYLMKQEHLESLTLKQIGSDTFLSSSTVIRACKKLGYHTFNDLRYDLRLTKEIQNQSGSSHLSSFEELKKQLTVEFTQTMSMCSEPDFDYFAENLIKARRIFCLGVGSSYMAMSDFNRKLKLVNLWSNDYFEHYSIKRIADIATQKDVVLVFSLSAKNDEVNQSIFSAKQNGAQILSITSLGNDFLSQVSDAVIYVYDAPKKHAKLRSRLMFNLVGTLLFEIILEKLQTGN
ncbi:MurR/RpiR family transcriptional regulator [Streptococcus pantholopis]|uniref:RpiR family transcriptional regulator n=1 Tax=Streptococcus pantholopis TaxID=1811193 RepID=A0A172Q689_9STRE|nr:MurR/RpiR family transcriptional regulator [Streptococcus pantholopis]AND78915.1 RpiR family transcriptional regulator [Streptococcus pantholopis]